MQASFGQGWGAAPGNRWTALGLDLRRDSHDILTPSGYAEYMRHVNLLVPHTYLWLAPPCGYWAAHGKLQLHWRGPRVLPRVPKSVEPRQTRPSKSSPNQTKPNQVWMTRAQSRRTAENPYGVGPFAELGNQHLQRSAALGNAARARGAEPVLEQPVQTITLHLTRWNVAVRPGLPSACVFLQS